MFRIKFEFYVLNYNFNQNCIVSFNIFNNCVVQDRTEKAIKKYVRNPKNYTYKPFGKDKKTLYGFEALCKEFESILKCEEMFRCEYEIAVGSIFITEVKDVIRGIDSGSIPTDHIYDELLKINKYKSYLEKWDCYQQAAPNIPMIMRECIYQYKEQKKNKKDGE